MGVAGCGKSTVGRAVAKEFSVDYLEGDDLHPAENISKMSRGEPLDDNDRWPWLELVGQALGASGKPAFIGCSALRRAYRDRLRECAGSDIGFVHLVASIEVIAGRMGKREGHFMPLALLDSQFATLEPLETDETGCLIDINQALDGVVQDVVRYVRKN